MPRCGRSAGATLRRSRPSKRIRPPRGATAPEIALNRVVLPAPFGPTMETNWRSPTDSETSHSAVNPPYATVISSSSSTGCRPFLAEIGLDHALLVGDLARPASHQDSAVVEHHQSAGEPHHGAHRVLDDHD